MWPRNDASARVDTGLMVNYGTRANESAIVDQLKQMAILAKLDVSSGTDTAKALYSDVIDGIDAAWREGKANGVS